MKALARSETLNKDGSIPERFGNVTSVVIEASLTFTVETPSSDSSVVRKRWRRRLEGVTTEPSSNCKRSKWIWATGVMRVKTSEGRVAFKGSHLLPKQPAPSDVSVAVGRMTTDSVWNFSQLEHRSRMAKGIITFCCSDQETATSASCWLA